MFLAFARMFGIPVPFARMFGFPFPKAIGLELPGDPTMPPTFVSGPMAAVINPIRNAWLAAFVWREHSLLMLNGGNGHDGVYVVFGDGAVMPRLIQTPFVLVKHGREACRFAAVDSRGGAVRFHVVDRGLRPRLIQVARDMMAPPSTDDSKIYTCV